MSRLTFPTTAADFIAYQEELIGATLDSGEKEVVHAYISILNDVYKEARAGNATLFNRAVRMADQALTDERNSDIVRAYMCAFKDLCIEAQEQGQREVAS